MSIKILNEGFELLHKNSLCEEKSNSSDLEKALEDALNRLAMRQEMNIKKYEIAFQDAIESQHPDKSWWEVTDCNIFSDLAENRDPSLTIKHILAGLKPELKEAVGEDSEKEYKVRKPIKESLRRKRLGESEKEPEIKRYSDVRPRSERKYWYFTTHGVQPGSIPRDLNVLEVRDGQNDRGTWGTYVMLDGVLNTSELKKYDMRELVPPMHESKKQKYRLKESYDYFETEDAVYSTHNGKHYVHRNEWDKISPAGKYWKQEISLREYTKAYRISEYNKGHSLKESFEEPVYSMPVSIKVRNGYLETDVSIWEDGDEYALDIGEENPVETPNKEKITSDWIQNKIPYVSWDWYDSDLDYMKHQCKKAVNAIENFFEENPLKESLKRKNKKSLKESKKLNESFDDMEVFMNTWANYNENGADSGITPTGWMSIDDAIEYCEEYADYEPFINDTDNVPFDDINEYSNASSVLQELKELQESDVDEDVVAAIVEATGYGIKEAVEIAERGDYYWYPGISSYTDLAYAVIDEIGSLKDALGDRVVNYIDEDQMRREYRWDIREIMRDTAEQEVDDAHEGEDEDSYDREQEIEDWMDEHEDEYLDMIIDEDIRMAEAGEVDLSNYFDYEAFGRDLSFDGYTITDKGIILVN